MWCLCVGQFMLSFVSISLSAAVIWSSKNHSYQFGSRISPGSGDIYRLFRIKTFGKSDLQKFAHQSVELEPQKKQFLLLLVVMQLIMS